MSVTATISGVAGPGQTVTAAVFTDCLGFAVNTANGAPTITLTKADATVAPAISIAGKTTFTVTLSGNTLTVSVS